MHGLDLDDAFHRAATDVLETARQMSRSGLVVSVWGNVSARVAGSGCAVVTPSGVDYERLDESMLCLVDVATGEKRAGRLKASSETKTHLALYRARPDVGGIVHTHSVYASAHAAARAPIPALVEDMAQVVGGTVECADYALAGTQALADNVVRGLGSRSAVLLANHGVFGVGPSVPEALRVCQIVEKAAWIHVLARTLGTPAVLPPEDVERLRDGYLHAYGQRTS